MVLPTSGSDWNAVNHDATGDVDTIDLTASSPEPDRRPQLPSQQHLPSYHEKEPRANLGIPMRVTTERRAVEMNPRASRQRVRQIHTQHMAQLIDTTNPQVLRTVLLDLCRLSPALSGALARGLAPYSTFAQTLTKQHRQTHPASTGRPVIKDESNYHAAYDRMKHRLLTQQSARGSSLNRVESPSTLPGTYKQRYAGSKSVPQMKKEPPSDMGDTDSDLDSFIPGAFSPSVQQQVKRNRLDLRDTSISRTPFREPTLRAPKSISLSKRSSRVQERPRVKVEPESCALCHNKIEDESETCFYHPSSKTGSDGKLVCGNCNGPLWDMGCLLGMHVSESAAQLERSLPGRSESPLKRPRIS